VEGIDPPDRINDALNPWFCAVRRVFTGSRLVRDINVISIGVDIGLVTNKDAIW